MSAVADRTFVVSDEMGSAFSRSPRSVLFGKVLDNLSAPGLVLKERLIPTDERLAKLREFDKKMQEMDR